ncbi:MAG TPA: exonuclease domain-containing protein [Acidimicrobiales bacterium]|nr:exonuclease domain-containing protein [Acidimicrobiales bacterium]
MALAVQQSFDDLGTPLREVTFVVLDVETTGGSPTGSSLTEVAAARYRGGEMLGTYQTLVKPDERIPPFITALTGISNLMVADAPTTGAMLPSFLEFLGGAVVVGHNVRFDLSFLNHALVSTGRDRLQNATVDTLALARRLVRDMVPNCKLGTLADSLDLAHRPSHRALNDVLATGDLLHNLLERAGSFGILGLEELLDLPRLVGHPQAAKLRLTTRLPHRPGVYWFTDAAGHVLYVGKATDLQARVRSYFTGDRRPKVGRLLRQLHGIQFRVCPGPLTAAVIEGRLIRAWSPLFNRAGKVRRKAPGTQARPAPTAESRQRSAGRRARHRTWTIAELAGDPTELLKPMAREVMHLAHQQWYEDAARVRDEADRLRHLIGQHRRVESLRQAGRMVLLVDGEGVVELDGGLLTATGTMFGTGSIGSGGSGGSGGSSGSGGSGGSGSNGAGRPSGSAESSDAADPLLAMTHDGHDQERTIVAQWLHAHPERVRVLEVESAEGISMPADRIPQLTDLCGPATEAGALAS